MKVLVSIVCLIALASAAQAARYNVVDLGTLSSGGTNRAYGINSSGVVVGSRTNNYGHDLAFFYDGTMHDVGVRQGYPNSTATGVNDSGAVIGYLRPDGGGDYRAFIYKNGKMTDLGTIPGYTYWTLGCAINNNDIVAGTSYTSSFSGHSFVYDGLGIKDMNSLTTPPSNGTVELVLANAINNLGQITGSTGPTGNAYLWKNGTVTNLGTLPSGHYSNGFGINDLGQVVGKGYTSNWVEHAFFYDGTMHDLGNLPGYLSSGAYDINNLGQIVGVSSVDYYNKHAFLYENGKMYDLNSLIDHSSGLTLLQAQAINDSGQIVGYAVDANNQEHAFLLTSVPEPSSIFALFSGIAGLGGLALRQRK